MMRCRSVLPGLIAAGLAASSRLSFAHDPGLSTVQVRETAEGLEATVTLAAADWAGLLQRAAGGEVAGSQETLEREALVLSLDGTDIASEAPVLSRRDDAVSVVLRFPKSPRPAGGALELRAPLLERLPHGHRQFVTVMDARAHVRAERLLDARAPRMEVPLAEADAEDARAAAFLRFLGLGVEHILFGWDHLAFLCGLLIVGPSAREAGKVITAFTAAHSLTLGLAALEIVAAPASVVEPLIAASVLFVGVENVLRREPARRWPLAFGFGLIHGFGFASVLRELGIGAGGAVGAFGTGVAAPLAGFNLGVEIGQIAVASLVLPLVWRMSRGQKAANGWIPFGVPGFSGRESAAPARPWWVPAGSTALACAGAIWFTARVL